MLYNISFDICAGVITLIALYTMVFRRDPGRFSNRVFLLVIVMHFISVVFDIWSSVGNSYIPEHSIAERDFTNYVFLGVHTSEAAVFFLFLLVQLGTFPTMKKWQHALVWMPEILMILLPLALNPAFRCVFGYDEAGLYVHGPLMILLYVSADLYMILCISFVVWKRDRMTKQQRKASLWLLLLSLIPMLVQSILIPHQLIEMFFQALGLCGYMLAVENVDESRNPVTKAWNRHALIRDFTYCLVNRTEIAAIIVKISQIDALRIASESSSIFHGLRLQLAEWFEQAARPKSMKFYDCERGAYVILISGKNAADACGELCRSIEKRFEAPWHCEGRKFHLSVQISEIRFAENPASVQDLLYMIAQPFVHQTEGISHANRRELLSSFRPGSAESGRLPHELQESLDRFLTGISDLTPAERNICDLYISGYGISEIPGKAFISMNTVKKHNKNIYRKLGVNSREELMLYVDLFFRCGREDELAHQSRFEQQ